MDSFKVVLIGGSSVGKSSIFRRYMQGDFQNKSQVTMAASYMEKTVKVSGSSKPVKIQLWDTAGSERFKNINRIYYRDATAALVVYDITKKNTLYSEAEHWIKDVKANAPPHLIIGLCGNKSDLYQNQEVPLNELQQFASKHSIDVFNEASALNNTGINEIFQKIVQKIDEKRDHIANQHGLRGDTVRLKKDSVARRKKKCC